MNHLLDSFAKGSLRALTLMVLTALCPLAHAQAPSAAPKQILPQRADPYVFLHTDGYYYFTASVPEYDRIELRRTRSLAELGKAPPTVVWKKHDRGDMSHFIWAPELHFTGGKWYIYFAASRAGSIWRLRMYALENASPNPLEGTWTEKGEIKMEWDSFTLDATSFVHGGKRYMAWAQGSPAFKGTAIYLAKMDTPWSIEKPVVLLSKPEFAWEKQGPWVNEGPAVVIKNGRVFMTFSASRTDANYCMGLLTAPEDADLLNPASWQKSPEPVFKSNALASQYGPGHNCFTTTPDGKTVLNVYHARNYEKIQGEPLYNPDRSVYIQPVRWNSDGMIDLGLPGENNLLPSQ
jgi:GH43 family beta-xylosidase